MASYLGEYGGNYGSCATDRVAKFRRAVQSVVDQTLRDWELIVVADGCEVTWELQHEYSDPRIRFLSIPKQRLWSGRVRNAGIHLATGRRIVYLDTDDIFAPDHLASVAKGMDEALWPDVGIMNDRVWDPVKLDWVERVAVPTRENGIGTSNLVHMRAMYWPEPEFRWPAMGYDHDRVFFRYLQAVTDPVHITGGRYLVCHIPRQYEI